MVLMVTLLSTKIVILEILFDNFTTVDLQLRRKVGQMYHVDHACDLRPIVVLENCVKPVGRLGGLVGESGHGRESAEVEHGSRRS